MSPGFFTTLHSSDHNFTAALRFLDDYARHIHSSAYPSHIYHSFVPRFDLVQHDDAYELYGDLPGFRREDIIIEANDNCNIQVSGCLSRLTTLPKGSRDSPPIEYTTEPPMGSQQEDLLNGNEPNSYQGPSPAAKQSMKKFGSAPKDRLERATTRQERYLNSRFGDVLDPNAPFVDSDEVINEDKQTSAKPSVRYLISERHPTQFHRTFHLPTPIRKDEVTATMEDGVLHITAPRAPMPPPVKVPIKSHTDYYDTFIV